MASVTKYSSLQQLSAYTLGFMGAISLFKGKANINRPNFSGHFYFTSKIGHASLKPGPLFFYYIICLSLRLRQITQTSLLIIHDIMLNLIQ